MNPTLATRQLHAFSALAHRRSYTRAAEDLSMTQSAVSHSIQALEKNLGVQLVIFSDRRVVLTPPAEKILRHTRKILREMIAIRAHADTVANDKRRALRLPLPAKFRGKIAA